MQAELQTALFQAFDTLNLQRVKSFSVPPVTLCGLGALSACGQEAQARGLSHLLVMVDSFLHQAGMTAGLERSLAMKGIAMTLWPCPAGEPCVTDVCAAVAQLRDARCDGVVAFGGGSVLDGTKFIAAAAQYADGIDPWRILETHGNDVTSAIPMGSVLTLPATGSESNSGAVISRKTTGDKLAFMTPFVQPVFAVLDPVYTYTLPPRQVANGVVNAFVHTVEQYVTYPVDGKIQDRFAEGILLTLVEEGPKALQEPENYNVRANVMWAATQALNGLIGAGVPQDWATHMLGHELTAMHGLDHAQTLAIVLPALWNEKRDTKRAKLLQYAERIWNITEGSDDQRIDAAIAATRAFFEQMGVPTRLSDYGLDGSSIPALLAKLEEHGMTKLGEHQDITLDVSRRIYEAAR